MGSIRKLQDESAQLKKQIEELQAEAMRREAEQLFSQIEERNGLKLLRITGTHPANFARDLVPTLKQRLDNERFALLAATESDGKPSLTVFLSQPLIAEGKSAGNMIKVCAKLIQGGGGGQPMLATAGGRDAGGLAAAMTEMEKMLEA